MGFYSGSVGKGESLAAILFTGEKRWKIYSQTAMNLKIKIHIPFSFTLDDEVDDAKWTYII